MQRYRYNSMLRKALLVDIEAARELMIEIGLEEGFTSDNTILISQFVDQLLNKLEEININD
ncbi:MULTISPECIES: aspartyl-phosphate phosphatase Spo0E family protein [Priestia]|uniref:aspartyl-phosphate phosphatase Spo0E family protein n=1 Tax=Priestia TaxID=2800373 RepID=UPI000BF9716E|nr:aspartyl-phosphate phosphatase Spo0E family protein [Priestia megaterium]MBZ6485118.1 aspartyl-phosphate phosphatase Spo0E family protein [Priestia aryabhattai]RFB32400.1 aspartyl-phosphate phosphatase Spo0E family protein [Bacillus sp. RC]MCA4158163.1 aspartyl-phosphate phosphatase Spo0E family protein [Priestia megaterium]MDP1442599.1 aspartyl-phosphate phosphatase Spo0E family protein [Priestia megaterium]MDP1471564.1 aspartyl-phosphate phosphatase Spo0E family protein [Priestia megateri